MKQFDTEVLTSGFFQILHAGHIELLKFASSYGKVTAAVNGDEYALRRYGDKAMPTAYRLFCLESCRYVEHVTVFNEPEPSELILKLKPRYYIRGYDWADKPLAEQAALEIVGSELIIFKSKKIKIHSSDYF